MGGGTKLRGLLKYLQQTIEIPVEKPDAFKRLAVAPGGSAAKFHENVNDFGIVYGLGLQGLGMARIESNLLPTSIARSMAWAGKMKYFIGAAVMLLTVSLMCLGRVGLDRISYAKSESTRSMVRSVVREATTAIEKTRGVGDQETQFQDRMRKQFEQFQYREVVPELYEIIISALPNAKTNAAQAALYQAFERGDVEQVMQVPRAERKQLFLTHVSLYYADDLATAQFGKTAMMRKDAMMRMAESEEMGEYEDQMMAEMEEIYGREYMEQFGMYMGGSQQEQKDPGFVVTVVGYSPYKDVGALLDPPNVKSNPSRWGFLTRLENLKQFLNLDVNSPFELYTREADHFRLERGPVDLDLDVPMGVGVMEIIPDKTQPTTPVTDSYMMGSGFASGTPILVDPMTRETISAEPVTDQYGNPRLDPLGKPMKKAHDQWFTLEFKLLWKNAPVEDSASTGTMIQ
jgi:hypothetical protein